MSVLRQSQKRVVPRVGVELTSKILDAITEHQREFLDGTGPLRPLTYRAIAQAVSCDQASVCRAVAAGHAINGHALEDLFSPAMPGPDGPVSTTACKDLLCSIVLSEPEVWPYSDDDAADALDSLGIQASRRVIAKWRGERGIPSSHQRRA